VLAFRLPAVAEPLQADALAAELLPVSSPQAQQSASWASPGALAAVPVAVRSEPEVSWFVA
jgi:hypothetical protein